MQVFEAGYRALSKLSVLILFLIPVGGGTIFQLLFPAVCGVHLWRQGSRLGWQLCLFWFGENLLNISVYSGDAISQALPLVGAVCMTGPAF